MALLTVVEDGRIENPRSLRERLGLLPGTKMAVDEEECADSIRLRVLPAEAQLVDKDGAWVIRSGRHCTGEEDEDWVARVREERIASLLGEH